MSVLGLTLARGGSKRVPRKNVKPLCGKPLIGWTVDECRTARTLDHYAVVSDDEEILRVATECGATQVIKEGPVPDLRTRLVSLSQAIATIERERGMFDYIVDVRCTNPLFLAEDIDSCVNLLAKSRADSAISVCRVEDHHPARIKWLDDDCLIHDFIPEPPDGLRQNLRPEAYVRNGCIYAYRRDAIVGDGAKLFGHARSLAYVMPPERSVNIDTPLDFRFAEFLMRERLSA